MIKKLHLVNFQSHKDTEFNFSKKVNVIIGPSRHGKTSIFRALRWLIENRPSGDEFKSSWAKKEPTCADLELYSGETISRLKNSSDNIYRLNGEVFSGFGQDVPKPISEVLNLSKINLQLQFDSPFLLFDSPGQVARFLNQIVHIDLIDVALANITSARRRNEQEIKTCNSLISELNELIEQFPDLVAVEEYVVELENQQNKFKELSYKCNKINEIQSRLNEARVKLEGIVLPPDIEPRITELIQKQSELEQLEYTLHLLRKIQADLLRFKNKKSSIKSKLISSENINLLIEQNSDYQQSKKMLVKLKKLHEKISSSKSLFNEKTTAIKQLEQKLDQLMPPICPLCGSVLKHDINCGLAPA